MQSYQSRSSASPQSMSGCRQALHKIDLLVFDELSQAPVSMADAELLFEVCYHLRERLLLPPHQSRPISQP